MLEREVLASLEGWPVSRQGRWVSWAIPMDKATFRGSVFTRESVPTLIEDENQEKAKEGERERQCEKRKEERTNF